MLLLPALITFSVTVVTAATVKKHHSILHYELEAVAYPSIPPSQFLLFTANATSAKSCAETCNKDAACKYFSFYEMLTNEQTYCSYYKSSSPFGKLEHMKERHVKGFRAYSKIVHVIIGHGHANGTKLDTHHQKPEHAIKSSHSADHKVTKTLHPTFRTKGARHGKKGGEDDTTATITFAGTATATSTKDHNKHGKGGKHDDNSDDGDDDAATSITTIPIATATTTPIASLKKHGKGGKDSAVNNTKGSKHGKGGAEDSNDDDSTATTTTTPVVATSTASTKDHKHGKGGGRNKDKRSIALERQVQTQSCGMKCWATRVTRGFKAF